jgi:hypothetical protein
MGSWKNGCFWVVFCGEFVVDCVVNVGKGARNFLDETLTAAMAGNPVPVASSRPYGCSLKYARWILSRMIELVRHSDRSAAEWRNLLFARTGNHLTHRVVSHRIVY